MDLLLSSRCLFYTFSCSNWRVYISATTLQRDHIKYFWLCNPRVTWLRVIVLFSMLQLMWFILWVLIRKSLFLLFSHARSTSVAFPRCRDTWLGSWQECLRQWCDSQSSLFTFWYFRSAHSTCPTPSSRSALRRPLETNLTFALRNRLADWALFCGSEIAAHGCRCRLRCMWTRCLSVRTSLSSSNYSQCSHTLDNRSLLTFNVRTSHTFGLFFLLLFCLLHFPNSSNSQY